MSITLGIRPESIISFPKQLSTKLARWDLILCGEGSIDAYSRQVGPRLAEALGVPALTQVTRVEASEGKLAVHRSLEDRTLILDVPLPALLTVGQEINVARFPTVLQIMGASRKPQVQWTLSDLGFAEEQTASAMSGIRTLALYAPKDEREQVPIQGATAEQSATELARVLFERGLVKVE